VVEDAIEWAAQRSEGTWTGPEETWITWEERVKRYKATHESNGSSHDLEKKDTLPMDDKDSGVDVQMAEQKDSTSMDGKDAPIDGGDTETSAKAEKLDDSEFEEYFTSKSSNHAYHTEVF
jgi:hypothetical protein